jgi:uncharacterized membrane protein YkvA (DUF1232 family)
VTSERPHAPAASERPRDRLGRPLPIDAAPDLIVPGIGSITGLDDGQVWALALDYLERGLPFHAHEVFEARWRVATPDDRLAWQALAQWAAALTHSERGNDEGARRLAERATGLMADALRVPECVDTEMVLQSCRMLS